MDYRRLTTFSFYSRLERRCRQELKRRARETTPSKLLSNNVWLASARVRPFFKVFELL